MSGTLKHPEISKLVFEWLLQTKSICDLHICHEGENAVYVENLSQDLDIRENTILDLWRKLTIKFSSGYAECHIWPGRNEIFLRVDVPDGNYSKLWNGIVQDVLILLRERDEISILRERVQIFFAGVEYGKSVQAIAQSDYIDFEVSLRESERGIGREVRIGYGFKREDRPSIDQRYIWIQFYDYGTYVFVLDDIRGNDPLSGFFPVVVTPEEILSWQ